MNDQVIELLTKECKRLHKVMEDSLKEVDKLEEMIKTLKDNNNRQKTEEKRRNQEEKEEYDDQEEEEEGPDEM